MNIQYFFSLTLELMTKVKVSFLKNLNNDLLLYNHNIREFQKN